jgi:hypothetical protein
MSRELARAQIDGRRVIEILPMRHDGVVAAAAALTRVSAQLKSI